MTPCSHALGCVPLMIAMAVAIPVTVRGEVPNPPVPVEHVDLDRYAGLWYEIARLPNRFQDQCVREVTARYEILKDGRVRVTNSCVGKDGKVSQVEGIAKIVDAKSNARLKVSFFSILGVRPFWGDYWVLGLGENYEFAVVGTPDRKYGWVLSRTPQPAPEILEKAWQVLKDQGYDAERFQRNPAG